MKKSLIALAALAATASFAQSSVTLSGAVDVAYANKAVTSGTGTNLGKATGVSEGQNTANRINFAMTEDLGGGLKAGAMVEMGLNITNGQLVSTRAAAAGLNVVNAGSTTAEIPTGSYSTSTNRQSYVFANGSFGEVRAGYTRTNLYELSTFSGYLVGQEQYGSLLHTFGNSVFGGTRGNSRPHIIDVGGESTRPGAEPARGDGATGAAARGAGGRGPGGGGAAVAGASPVCG